MGRGQDRVVRGSLDRIGEECYLRIIFHSFTSFFTPSEDNLYFMFLLPLSPSMFFLQWQCYKIMTHFKVNITLLSKENASKITTIIYVLYLEEPTAVGHVPGNELVNVPLRVNKSGRSISRGTFK